MSVFWAQGSVVFLSENSPGSTEAVALHMLVGPVFRFEGRESDRLLVRPAAALVLQKTEQKHLCGTC